MGRSKKAKHKKPIPLSDDIKNALLGRDLFGIARQVRSGRTLPVLPQIRWSQKPASKVRDALQAWLDTGKFEPLLQLLEALPEAISYPAVVLLVRNLRRLARWTDEEVDYGLWNEEEDPPPLGTCKAAGQLLEQLASAVVSGLFQKSGFRVVPPVKRGRPKRSLGQIMDANAIESDYRRVFAHLGEHQHDFKRLRGERQDAWEHRLTGLIKRTWAESGIGTTFRTVPSASKGIREQSDHADPFDRFRRPFTEEEVSIPLEDRIAQDCAQEVAGKLAAPLHQIAYWLVGHRWKKQVGTVRYYVQIARK